MVVFIHELGHFLAARSVGVRVEKFYVGFDFWFSVQKVYKGKDTEYGVGLFPFGGYCKIAGMVDESLDDNVKGLDDEFNSKNTIEKLWILSAGVIMNFILAIVLFMFIYNYYGLQQQLPIVDKVNKNLAVNKNDIINEGSTILSINDKKVTYWSDIDKIINSEKTETVNVKFLDSRKNIIKNIIMKPENIIPFYYPLFLQLEKNGAVMHGNDSISYMNLGLSPLPEAYLLPYVKEVVENSPAFNSKLTDKSLILKMNDKEINTWDDITLFLDEWDLQQDTDNCINIKFKNYSGINIDCIKPSDGKLGIIPSIEKVKMLPENITFKNKFHKIHISVLYNLLK